MCFGRLFADLTVQFLIKRNNRHGTGCTYIQDELPSLHTASRGGIVLQRLGQTVQGFELLVILLVLHLKGHDIVS